METVEITEQTEFTESERGLAEKFKVEPKTVRLINEIVSQQLKELEAGEQVEEQEAGAQGGGQEPEAEVDEVVRELKRHLIFVPEAQLEALIVLQSVLPKFEEKHHASDVNTIGGIVEYAKTHSDFNINWCGMLDSLLKDLVKILWPVEPALREKAVKKVIESCSAVVETRTQISTAGKRVYSIYGNLDLRTKILMGIGGELESMSGVNVSAFADILDQFRQGADELIVQARKDPKLSKDTDIMYLCELYELACYVNEKS